MGKRTGDRVWGQNSEIRRAVRFAVTARLLPQSPAFQHSPSSPTACLRGVVQDGGVALRHELPQRVRPQHGERVGVERQAAQRQRVAAHVALQLCALQHLAERQAHLWRHRHPEATQRGGARPATCRRRLSSHSAQTHGSAEGPRAVRCSARGPARAGSCISSARVPATAAASAPADIEDVLRNELCGGGGVTDQEEQMHRRGRNIAWQRLRVERLEVAHAVRVQSSQVAQPQQALEERLVDAERLVATGGIDPVVHRLSHIVPDLSLIHI